VSQNDARPAGALWKDARHAARRYRTGLIRNGDLHEHGAMRIAIVGAGIAGLTAAHYLHPEHDVTVFEAGDKAGGHTNTIAVSRDDGEWAVDTGFIVFNDRNYPHFTALLEELGVAWQPSEMSFSVAATGYDFEYSGTPRGLFGQRSNLTRAWFLRMVREYRQFNSDARDLLRTGDSTTSLGEFLEQRGYSQPFIDRLLVPQASAVWSADPRRMWSFPAGFLCEFFDNHGMLALTGRPKWRTVKGGSQRYVDALVVPLHDRIHTGAAVVAIERDPGGVDITVAGAEPQRFDEVVIAAHSDQALAMLADPTPAEHELLTAIPYEPNEAVLHTDRSLLPRRRRVWSSWNYHLLDEPTGKSTVTYHMNTLQALDAPHEFCVTLNQRERIDPDRVVRTITYSHPVFTPTGIAAQRRRAEISGVNHTHYCGAYWGWGFHEDGVVSALNVVREIARTHPRERVAA
jgi:predicted NAD/FAD-binding protein